MALKDESASKRTGRKSTSSILSNEEIESELQEVFKLQAKLRNPDKLVIAAKKYLAGQKADNYKYIGTKNGGWDYPNMRMGVANIDRALQIMDTLIKALRARGHDLQVKNHSTVATVHGHEFKILLRERTKREVSVENSWPKSVFIPTGILTIKLDSYLQKEWMDGKLKLEEQLSAIIAYLEIKAKEENEREAEWKREEEEREREKRRLQEFEERQEKELAAFEAALSSASRWHKANNFRQYIDAVEAKAKATGPISKELNDWLSWARRKADWYDPFVEGNDELLNGIDKEILIVKKKSPNYFG